jgi:hypothetical protein
MNLSKMRAYSSQTRLLILAPAGADIPAVFEERQHSAVRHEALLSDMQRFRGKTYLRDGAIEWHELDDEGRHQIEIDRDSWHLLAMDPSGAICGCVRYDAHNYGHSFNNLWVRHSALANSPTWGRAFRTAVESGLEQARRRKVSYVEVGGWAIAEERRWTFEALRIALATYGLAQALGGCIGITTATMRHCSSSILRRIGGFSLRASAGELPPYYDPQFKCDMEVLSFDSERPASKYSHLVAQLRSDILKVPVISQGLHRSLWSASTEWRGFPADQLTHGDYTLQPA